MAAETLLSILSDLKSMPKKMIDLGCTLIESLLGYPLSAAGGLAGDSIYRFQCSQRIKIAARTKELLDEKKVDPRVLAPGFLFTYFEAAGNADDSDEVRELWAKLLASAVESEEHGKKAYINVLKQLGLPEARLLQSLANGAGFPPQLNGYTEQTSPEVGILMMLGLLERKVIFTSGQPALMGMNGIEKQATSDRTSTRLILSPFGKSLLAAIS